MGFFGPIVLGFSRWDIAYTENGVAYRPSDTIKTVMVCHAHNTQECKQCWPDGYDKVQPASIKEHPTRRGRNEMLGYKVFGAGLHGLAVQAICQDAGTSLSAAGTSQADATELVNADNEVTTVGAGAGVVLSSDASAGDTQTVFNAGANALKVYPPSGGKINALPTDQAVTLAVNTGCLFKMVSSTRWFGVLSA